MAWKPVKRAGLFAFAAFTWEVRDAVATEASANGAFRLAWVRAEGGDACVAQSELERRVRVRLGRNPFDLDADQSIEGEISFANGVGRATLRVRDGRGALLGRRALEVAATDCAGLTDAIVLAVALTIDPRASLDRPSASQSASEPPLRAAGEPPREHTPLPCVPPARAPVRACPACRVPPCPAPPQHSLQVTLRALGAAGVLPELAPGVALSAAALGPRIWLTAGLTFFPERDLGDFAFGLSTADVGGCWSAGLLPGISPRLCAELQVGAMHAVVREREPLRPGDHLWAALRVGPIVGVRPYGPLLVEAGLLAVVPVVRPRFAVRGEAGSEFESRPLGGTAFLGAGIFVP